MRVQNISKTQNFQGGISVVGDMSPVLKKNLSDTLKNINFENKSYSLLIKNQPQGDFLSIVARNEAGKSEKKYTVLVHTHYQRPDILKDAVQDAMSNYERLYPPTFTEKCKMFFNKLGKKLFDVITDE